MFGGESRGLPAAIRAVHADATFGIPDREPARAQPEPGDGGRDRPLRGAAPAGRRMTGRALPLLLCALLGACSTLARPRASSYHPSDADLSVTRIVHGSLILELRGTRVLVDPWFHAGLLTRQAEPLGLVPDGLPTAAAILVTRDAPEHLDHRALRDLAAKVPRAIAPATLHATLVDLGFAQVDDLAWWERTTIDGVTVTAVPGGPRGGPRQRLRPERRVDRRVRGRRRGRRRRRRGPDRGGVPRSRRRARPRERHPRARLLRGAFDPTPPPISQRPSARAW